MSRWVSHTRILHPPPTRAALQEGLWVASEVVRHRTCPGRRRIRRVNTEYGQSARGRALLLPVPRVPETFLELRQDAPTASSQAKPCEHTEDGDAPCAPGVRNAEARVASGIAGRVQGRRRLLRPGQRLTAQVTLRPLCDEKSPVDSAARVPRTHSISATSADSSEALAQ